MIEKITNEELIVWENLANPINCSEILFDDFDNLGHWSDDKFGFVRPYQYHYLPFDMTLFEKQDIKPKQFFDLKKRLAELYVFGGRLTGKTLFAVVVSVLLTTLHKAYKWGAVSSYDADHVKGVMEKIIIGLENHPLFIFLNTKNHTTRNPYKIKADNGCLLESVNNNILGKNAGQHWFSKHVDRNWEEESSFLTKEVSNKKLMAQSELGCIKVYSGMTTFSKDSPVGELFYNLEHKGRVINLPSYANPTWDEEKEKNAILEFGGEQSATYKVQIVGEVVENSESVYDIERVRETYNLKNPIKAFEINRLNFYRYKDILIVDTLTGAESIWLAADVGEGGAPTEIIVLFKINGIYKYIYNITTHKLSHEEDLEIFYYLIDILKINYIGLDITSGGGKALACSLGNKYRNRVTSIAFNERIAIDYDKNGDNSFKRDNNGKLLYKYERVDVWSIQRLKHIFYNKKIQCLMDFKLDIQLNGIIVTTSPQGKPLYGSKVPNHLHQAFQVFGVMEWLKEFDNTTPIIDSKPTLGIFDNA